MRVLFSKGIVAISKPRCGSTSVRRMLDPFLSAEAGDIAVNIAGENPPFHPHVTAPFLQKILRENYPDAAGLEYFITVRHPINMLQSYFKFFEPDERCRYNFSPGWSGKVGMTFEEWVLTGRVGMNPDWQRLGPESVTTQDLSPLSFEAHAMHRDGHLAVDHVFPIEKPEAIGEWLSKKIGTPVGMKHVNQSRPESLPILGDEAIGKIRRMMPMESKLYEI